MHKENAPNTGFNFRAKRSAVIQARREILQEAGSMTVHFVKNAIFPAEGFIDRSVEKWPKKKARYGGKTLVKTGKGKASIKVLSVGQNRVKIGTNVPYMHLHQHGIGFPRRKFIGHSHVLSVRIAKMIDQKISKAMLR